MKRSILLCLSLILFLFAASSCSINEEQDERERLQMCARLIPGAWPSVNDTYLEMSIIEKDEYGRVLFEFENLDEISGRILNFLVICQVDDAKGERIYYYEDMHFLMSPYTAEELTHFKQVNDWNKPLDYSKMSMRKYEDKVGSDYRYDFIVNPRGMSQAFADFLGIEMKQIKTMHAMDVLGNQQICYIKVTRNNVKEKYIVYMEAGGKNVQCLKIENDTVDYAAYRQFKIDCGWAYP